MFPKLVCQAFISLTAYYACSNLIVYDEKNPIYTLNIEKEDYFSNLINGGFDIYSTIKDISEAKVDLCDAKNAILLGLGNSKDPLTLIASDSGNCSYLTQLQNCPNSVKLLILLGNERKKFKSQNLFVVKGVGLFLTQDSPRAKEFLEKIKSAAKPNQPLTARYTMVHEVVKRDKVMINLLINLFDPTSRSSAKEVLKTLIKLLSQYRLRPFLNLDILLISKHIAEVSHAVLDNRSAVAEAVRYSSQFLCLRAAALEEASSGFDMLLIEPGASKDDMDKSFGMDKVRVFSELLVRIVQYQYILLEKSGSSGAASMEALDAELLQSLDLDGLKASAEKCVKRLKSLSDSGLLKDEFYTSSTFTLKVQIGGGDSPAPAEAALEKDEKLNEVEEVEPPFFLFNGVPVVSSSKCSSGFCFLKEEVCKRLLNAPEDCASLGIEENVNFDLGSMDSSSSEGKLCKVDRVIDSKGVCGGKENFTAAGKVHISEVLGILFLVGLVVGSVVVGLKVRRRISNRRSARKKGVVGDYKNLMNSETIKLEFE